MLEIQVFDGENNIVIDGKNLRELINNAENKGISDYEILTALKEQTVGELW